jgi:hypothetical protein
VPGVIYTIAARYPVHRVTYVKVEPGDDEATVVCRYTAGYYGAFVAGVATTAALVYGTGWYYPPYVYRAAVPIYRPWGATYGCAAAYNPWTGGYVAGGAAYGPYGAAGRAAWYNPATGGYGRAASVQTAYGGRTVAAGYNPGTNTGWATRQGNNGYAQWGTSAVSRGDDWVRAGHVATEEGGVARWRGSEGGGKVKWTDDGAKGVAVHDDNLYAGKDGNVYRKSDDGWAKYDDGDWESVDKPERKNPSSQSAGGKSQQKPPQQKSQSPPQDQRPGAADRPPAGERPSTLPADRQRPQAGERPSTMPAERQRPQASDGTPIEQRPSTRPARTQPSDDVMSGLNRESGSRSRSSEQVNRQQNFQRSGGGAEFGGSRNFERGGGGGAGGARGGGDGRGGGGGRRR